MGKIICEIHGGQISVFLSEDIRKAIINKNIMPSFEEIFIKYLDKEGILSKVMFRAIISKKEILRLKISSTRIILKHNEDLPEWWYELPMICSKCLDEKIPPTL